MTPEEAQQITNAYGAALAAPGGLVRDVQMLPYPKERIKQALLIAIRLTPSGNDREQLKSGYIALGDWQDTRATNAMTAMMTECKALLAELKSLNL